MGRAWGWVTSVTGVVALICYVLGIWTRDERWSWTASIFLVPMFVAACVWAAQAGPRFDD